MKSFPVRLSLIGAGALLGFMFATSLILSRWLPASIYLLMLGAAIEILATTYRSNS